MNKDVCWESYCHSHRRIHTLPDLLSIQLEPTRRPIKLLFHDPYILPSEIPISRLERAWLLYNARQNAGPKTLSRLDQFRWKLRLTLVKWGII